MFIKKTSALIAFLGIFCLLAQAQNNYSLQGQVTDDKGGPVELATVILFIEGDSTWRKLGTPRQMAALFFLASGQNLPLGSELCRLRKALGPARGGWRC